jgi:hypothetical protein
MQFKQKKEKALVFDQGPSKGILRKEKVQFKKIAEVTKFRRNASAEVIPTAITTRTIKLKRGTEPVR